VKGDYVVARYSLDNEWYRAKVDKASGNAALLTFIDYGNQETVTSKDIARIPSSKFEVGTFPAVAKNYALAFVSLPDDPELIDAIKSVFQDRAADSVLLLKSEYKDISTGLDHVTLQDELKKDIILELVNNGWFIINKERRRERRLQNTITEYRKAQDSAKKNRLNLWRYGDFTEDDAKEFGYKATA
jgi:staphylococcal nuclease domain-containing protein 1